MFPRAVTLLADFRPDGSEQLLDAQLYLTFAMRLLVAFGLAFVFPVVMVALTWVGIVPWRMWLKGWRWAVLLIFIFTAAMTPTPDAITMTVMAIPMCALYFGAIGIGALRAKTRGRAKSEQGRRHHQPHVGVGEGQGVGHRGAVAPCRYAGTRSLTSTRGSWAGSYEAAMKARRSLDALVVVGGDGMVHLGIQVCAEKKLPLGIVAAGSGNDAAMTLDLPIHDIPAAVERIEDGLAGRGRSRSTSERSPGGAVELPAAPRYFLAVLSAGIDAAIASYARRIKFPRGPLKYKVATLREVPRYKPYGVTVTADGSDVDPDVHARRRRELSRVRWGAQHLARVPSDRWHARARHHGAARHARDRQDVPQTV